MRARGPRVPRLCLILVLAFAGLSIFGTAPAWAGTNTELACEWTVDKSASVGELTLQIGETRTVTYTITVDGTCQPPTGHTAGWPSCVQVEDSFFSPTKITDLCIEELPFEYSYERTVGPFSDCGEQSVENHAVLQTPGPGDVVIVNDIVTVSVNVLCEGVTPPPPPPPPGGGGGGGGGGAGGVSGGGGGSLGGEAAGGEAVQGSLPFTGLPAWMLVVAGLSLVGGGLALARAARTHS
jgi:uncharacterized membrane protein YgcG